MIWGPVVLPNGQSAFPIYHQLGVKVFQIDLNWAPAAPDQPANAENPNDPAYQWPAQLDQAVSSRGSLRDQDLPAGQGTRPAGRTASARAAGRPTIANDYGQFLIAAVPPLPDPSTTG